MGSLTSLMMLAGSGILALFLQQPVSAAEQNPVQKKLEQLEQQNSLLQEQLRKQQELIDALTEKVSSLEESKTLITPESASDSAKEEGGRLSLSRGFHLGNVMITGEGGVGFFHQDSRGNFPNAEFRVDEAKLFLEAPIWQNVFLFSELNIVIREENDKFMRMGELYLDFENISRLWGREHWLGLRLGRVDVPFGEEYLTRDAIDNPLISHSLSDFWGIDEGIELYGTIKPFHYVVAVVNGGPSVLQDSTADKSVIGRIAYEPANWVRLSVSGMRTGELDVQEDEESELWFGNGFIRALGPEESTTRFQANIWEGDVQFRWGQRHLKMAGGYLEFDDNDRAADNRRKVFYYYVEGVHPFSKRWYGAMRFSQILAPDGFPLVGLGTKGDFFFSDELTKDIWNWSIGIGYRWSKNLVAKAEYNLQGGKTIHGQRRTRENLFALQAAFRF